MPTNAPGSLSDNEVHAVSDCTLSCGTIAVLAAGLDAATAGQMPNRNGFAPDHCPELPLHH